MVLAFLALMSIRQTIAATLSDGLIGYWQFDGNGRDTSGGGRDLELVGGVGFAPGLLGSALDLHNNPVQYARRPSDDAVYDFVASDFSVQAWVNFKTFSDEQVLVEKYEGTDGPGWTSTVQPRTRGSSFHFWSDPYAVLYSPTQVMTTGSWHHVLTRRKGSSFDIFHDGTHIASGSDSDAIPNTSFPLLIGTRNAADGRGFPVDGRIDEVAIWNRGLTDQEVARLYNGGSGMLIPEPCSVALLATAWMGLHRARRRICGETIGRAQAPELRLNAFLISSGGKANASRGG